MSLIEAFVLGIVQGLSEFIPISSDGHLTLIPFMFGWEEPGLAFTVATHIGTLVALVWWYRKETVELIGNALRFKQAPPDQQLLIRLIVISTIPAVFIGALAESLVADAFERPVIAVLFLGITGYMLISTETFVADREAEARPIGTARARDAWIIGFAQATAILPGISRSGMTIATGMRLGLTRTASARFSFLMAIPVIFGAIVFQIPDMMSEGLFGEGFGSFLIGVGAAFVSGFLAIRWFLGALQRHGLKPFGVYCIFAMIAGLLTALAR
ncbi:MAG TPA: undecaprenyl-diphosphate phosphatase, partial [Actinomycetota bacterium]|nr:undecaprenyl-diphosphate phosphatase [Actinomycetota bacterium]